MGDDLLGVPGLPPRGIFTCRRSWKRCTQKSPGLQAVDLYIKWIQGIDPPAELSELKEPSFAGGRCLHGRLALLDVDFLQGNSLSDLAHQPHPGVHGGLV